MLVTTLCRQVALLASSREITYDLLKNVEGWGFLLMRGISEFFPSFKHSNSIWLLILIAGLIPLKWELRELNTP